MIPLFLRISLAECKLEVEVRMLLLCILQGIVSLGKGGIDVGVTGRPAPTVRLIVGFSSFTGRVIVRSPVDILLACSKYSNCFCIFTSSNGQLRAAINAPLIEPAVVDTAIVDRTLCLSKIEGCVCFANAFDRS